MRTSSLASLAVLTLLFIPACSDDAETCADGDCSGPGGGSPTTTTTSSSTGAGGGGGAGGGEIEPLNTEVVFTDYLGERHAAAQVLVSNADGSVAFQGETDASGELAVTIPGGGSVSAFLTFSVWLQGQEFVVKQMTSAFPGEAKPSRIALSAGFSLESEPGGGMMVVGLTYPMRIGAADYQAKTNCFSVTSTDLSGGAGMVECTNDGLYDAVIAARDAAGTLLDYAVLEDLPFIDNDKVFHPMTWGGTAGELGNIPYNVANLSNDTQSVRVSSIATRDTHGAPIKLEQVFQQDYPTSDEIAGSITHAVGFGSSHCTDITVERSQTRVYAGRCSPTPDLTPFTIDASRLAGFLVVGGEPPTTVSWNEGLPGELGDMMLASASDAATDTMPGKGWTALVGPGVMSVTRPDLPPGLEDYAVVTGTKSIANVDRAGVDGFEAALETVSSAEWASESHVSE